MSRGTTLPAALLAAVLFQPGWSGVAASSARVTTPAQTQAPSRAGPAGQAITRNYPLGVGGHVWFLLGHPRPADHAFFAYPRQDGPARLQHPTTWRT